MHILYVNNNDNGRRRKNTVSAFKVDLDHRRPTLTHLANFATRGTGLAGVFNGARTITHLENKFLFVSNQGDHTISAFAIDRNGGLTPVGPPVPAGIDLTSGSLAVTPDGQFLYAGGVDGISGFRTQVGSRQAGVLVPVAASGPRLVTILSPAGSPNRVVDDLVVNPKGDFLVASIFFDQLLRVYRIDAVTGFLMEVLIPGLSPCSTSPKPPAGLAIKRGPTIAQDLLFVGGDFPGPTPTPHVFVFDMNAATGGLTQLLSFSFGQPGAGSSYLRLSKGGSLLFVGNDNIRGVTVLRVPPSGTPLTVVPNSPFIVASNSTASMLSAIELDVSGELVFTGNVNIDVGALHVGRGSQLIPGQGSPFATNDPNLHCRQSGMVGVLTR